MEDPLRKEPEEGVLFGGLLDLSEDLLLEGKFLMDMDFFIPGRPDEDDPVSMEDRLGDVLPLWEEDRKSLELLEPNPLMDIAFLNPDRPPLLPPSPDSRFEEFDLFIEPPSPDSRFEECDLFMEPPSPDSRLEELLLGIEDLFGE